MKQIIPENLKAGDTIGIVATARWIDPEILQSALEVIQGWGFRVKCGNYLHKRIFQLAGSDDERARDLQSMLDDPDIGAVVVARGGYGTVRIIDKIDFSKFVRHPKWVCGYSDVTVLHAAINSLGIATLHSTMPVSFADNPPHVLESLRLSLMGEPPSIQFEPDWSLNLPAATSTITGRLVGGNLSVLCSVLGSSTAKVTPDEILFLEDIDEHLYHIDRMLMALKRSGRFDSLKAILVGGMTGMKDNSREFGFSSDNPWGKTIREMFAGVIENSNIPVISGLPAGHQPDNRTLRMGAGATISIRDKGIELSF